MKVSELNCLLQKRFGPAKNAVWTFSTTASGFIAYVTILPSGQKFTSGRAAGSKQQAKELTAETALAELDAQMVPTPLHVASSTNAACTPPTTVPTSIQSNESLATPIATATSDALLLESAANVLGAVDIPPNFRALITGVISQTWCPTNSGKLLQINYSGHIGAWVCDFILDANADSSRTVKTGGLPPCSIKTTGGPACSKVEAAEIAAQNMTNVLMQRFFEPGPILSHEEIRGAFVNEVVKLVRPEDYELIKDWVVEARVVRTSGGDYDWALSVPGPNDVKLLFKPSAEQSPEDLARQWLEEVLG